MWNAIVKWFKDSETIFWARLQTVLGFVAVALTYIDPSLLPPELQNMGWFPWFLFANGIATEYLRRRREGGM